MPAIISKAARLCLPFKSQISNLKWIYVIRLCKYPIYSYRSASIGSSRAAFRAG